MKVLSVRNVHEALPRGLRLLETYGEERDSRNGPVRVLAEPVTTVYEKPLERVLFWPQRDANPFFHLYESLWMLAGRNDLQPLVRYVKDFGKFSDNGVTLHGAYGHRWRKALGVDQLPVLVRRLTEDPTDRRAVLQMWDATQDLDRAGKDVPCNTTTTLQRDADGRLDLTVFCRSNDIIWGAYGANAVHFAFLQEYLATCIGCPVGVYRQISVNYHAYLDTLRPLEALARDALDGVYGVATEIANPYAEDLVRPVRLAYGMDGPQIDRAIDELLMHCSTEFMLPREQVENDEPFFELAYVMLRAHHQWRTLATPERYDRALETLGQVDASVDWVLAARQWLSRRRDTWEARMRQEVQA